MERIRKLRKIYRKITRKIYRKIFAGYAIIL